MIGRPGRKRLRPWLLGAWVIVTAWTTAASFASPTAVPREPVGILALVLWVFVTLAIHWTMRRRHRAASSAQRLSAPMLAGATMLVISLILAPAMPLLARLGLALGAALVPAALLPLTGRIVRRARLAVGGAALAHCGAALVLVGIACATGLSSETRFVMDSSQPVRLGPWLVGYKSSNPVSGAGFTAIEAELRVTRGTGVSVLRPQRRTAIAAATESSAPALVTASTGRLSIGLGPARGDGREIAVSWMPFVTLVWLGGGLMAIGGLITLAGLRGARIALFAAALAAGIASYLLLAASNDPEPTPDNLSTAVWPSLVEQRGAFLGQFHRSSHWLIISDSYAARGETRDAAGILLAATRQHPRDFALWLGLGNALTAHGRGLNPAARLAFERSAELAPTSPAPGYFLGLAKYRSGDRAGALAEWQVVLANAPADASWRPIVEDGVASINDRTRAR